MAALLTLAVLAGLLLFLGQRIALSAEDQPWCSLAFGLIGTGILLQVKGRKGTAGWLNAGLLAAAGILSYIIFQIFIDADFTGTGKTLTQDIINVLCCLGVYGILYCLTGHLRASLLTGSSLLYLFGWVVYAIAQFRGDLLLFSDFFSVRTAMQVASGYQLALTGSAVTATLLFAGLVIWELKAVSCASKGTVRRLRAAAAGLCVLFYGVFFLTDIEQYAYTFDLKKNGYPYSFMISVKMFNVKPPEGYDPHGLEPYLQDKVQVANQEGLPVTETSTTETRPNIIVVMNESFSDLSVMGDFDTNIAVTPFIDSLEENTIKGNVSVSVFGGGTCDSEYTFLTGNTTAFLPENARPYQQYIHEAVPGLVSTLKDQGYSTLAMHSGWGTAWNRNRVYPLMGFDTFISEENEAFNGAERTRHFFISDKANYDLIEEAYENRGDAPFFAFDVTISNHSAYDKDASDLTPVWVEGHQGEFPETEQYLSLMHRSDADFQTLITYFEQVEEPTIILMFGDHQGYVDDSFYEFLKGKPLSDWSMEELQSRNTTPFVLWANYDIEEGYVEHTSLQYLAPMLLETAGLELSPYQAYLLDMADTLPIVNTLGIMDAEGHYYQDPETSPYSELIEGYQQLLYNNIIDETNRQTELYTLP